MKVAGRTIVGALAVLALLAILVPVEAGSHGPRGGPAGGARMKMQHGKQHGRKGGGGQAGMGADGKLIDTFHYGASLAGLAGAQIDGEPVLVIASEQGLEAWKLEPTGETLATPGGKELQ